ncbi:MAG: winged helix-turn-helix domain-containing protein [Candidatus Dormibacteria bacterium]
MLPLLRAVADGEAHRSSDLLPQLADEFGLTDEERSLRHLNGRGYRSRLWRAGRPALGAGRLPPPSSPPMTATRCPARAPCTTLPPRNGKRARCGHATQEGDGGGSAVGVGRGGIPLRIPGGPGCPRSGHLQRRR